MNTVLQGVGSEKREERVDTETRNTWYAIIEIAVRTRHFWLIRILPELRGVYHVLGANCCHFQSRSVRLSIYCVTMGTLKGILAKLFVYCLCTDQTYHSDQTYYNQFLI